MTDVAKTAPLAERLVAGDKRALARAITLIESTRPDHRAEAEALLARLLPATGKSIRIGISGPPGVGKSTFIERFGLHAERDLVAFETRLECGIPLQILSVDLV